MNQYPVWKYTLIALILLMGALYAGPNLYPEEPAIQVTTSRGFDLPDFPKNHPSGFQLYDYAITFSGLCLRCQHSSNQSTQ